MTQRHGLPSGPWRVDLTVRDGVDRSAGRRIAALARAVAAALDAAGAPTPASIGLILSDDARAGRAQRGPPGQRRARPTSCRSRCCHPTRSRPIAAGPSRQPPTAAAAFALPPGRRPHLGDIVVSVERAIEQAEAGPRRPDRRRPLVAGRRAAPPRDPRHAPRLRLGPRRAGRGGRDARPRAAAARRGLVAPGVSPVQLTEHTKPDPGGARPRAGVWSRRVAAYCFTYQSTAFQVGPAWVGLPTKLPAFALCRSTFWR